jgi:TonB family protein
MLPIIIGLLFIHTGYGQSDTLFSKENSVLETGDLKDGFKHGHWISYYPDGAIRSEGLFNEGVRVGEWTWYHPNGEVSSVEKWKRGEYKKGKYWDREGNPSDITEVLTHPEYPGGIEAFTQMVASNLQYPEQMKLEGIEGRVVLEFRINRNGRLVRPRVAEGAHPALEQEALRVVRMSDEWTPARFHGKNTTASYTFPIVFALQ